MPARLYTYILQTDNGGAPCVEKNLFSLAICKPRIRRCAREKYILVGISGNKMKIGKEKRIIFISIITNIITMKEYADKHSKRPDSIYSSDMKLLPNLFHECGSQEIKDLGGVNVLLSNNFIYFGNKHIAVPDNLRNIIPTTQGHKYKPNAPYKNILLKLFETHKKKSGKGKIGNYNNKQTILESIKHRC